MAKRRSLFGNLFNENGPIQAVIDGMAIGLGGPDRRAMAEKEAATRRAEQQKAVEAGEKARKEALAAQLPAERGVEIPNFESEILGGSGVAPVERAKMPEGQMPGQSPSNQGVPSLVSEQQPLTDPASIIPSGPTLFGDAMPVEQDAMGGYAAPVVDPMVEMESYIDGLEGANLPPDAQKNFIELKNAFAKAQSKELRPYQRQEVLQQAQELRDRYKIDRKVIKPPTVADEATTRIAEGPNGMQTILQPDGRIDTKDPTTKAELKQLEIQQKEQESRMTIESMRMQQQEQRRMEREQQRAEQMKVEKQKQQKIAEERAARYQEHWSKALKDKPMSDRYAEAQKELESTYKALNPKLPMKRFSPSEIRALAESKIALDFSANERFANPSNPLEQRKTKPEDRIREMIRTDPEGFREAFNDKKQELLSDTSRLADPTREEVFAAMLQDTPESLEAEFDAFLGKSNVNTAPVERAKTEPPRVRPSLAAAAAALRSGEAEIASPSDMVATDGMAEPIVAPPNPLRDGVDVESKEYRNQLTQAMAEQLGVEPSKVPTKEVDRQLAIPKLLANPGDKGSRKDGKYIQDMLPADRDRVFRTAAVIMDGDDYDKLAPGQLGISAKTGKLVTKPVIHPDAQALKDAVKNDGNIGLIPGSALKGTKVVTNQAEFDDVKEGESYMHGFTGRMVTKRKGSKFEKSPKTLGDEAVEAGQGYIDTVLKPLARQITYPLFGK